jgi:hypothetical protein
LPQPSTIVQLNIASARGIFFAVPCRNFASPVREQPPPLTHGQLARRTSDASHW